MGAGASSAPEVDPIELEIIQEAMISIVREMRVNLVATAYSSIIYEAYDFSCVLIDGQGQIVALAEDNPSHIFPVPWSVKQMFDTFGEDIQPGDVFLHNDPYTGGTHLNDIAMMFPVFAEDRLVLFPTVRAHWGDVGGTTPGSISGKSTEIFPRRRAPADREDRQRRRTEPGPVRRDDGQHARAAGAARRFHVDLGHLPGRRTAHRRIVRAVWRRDRRGRHRRTYRPGRAQDAAAHRSARRPGICLRALSGPGRRRRRTRDRTGADPD